jgi:signal transduction histidine kinase
VEHRVELGTPLRLGILAALAFVGVRWWHRSTDAAAARRAEAERAELVQRERAARDEVAQAHAEMESLLYTVSHDLKSPLLTVLGYIDLLRTEGAVPDGAPAQFIERMEASALYMQRLISDLLELSRIGRHDGAAEEVNLVEVVGEVADEVRGRHPDACVEIGGLPVVTMSPVRARQLMTNLVGNAVVHGGRPDVEVEVGSQARSDGGVRVWVADDGQGVPPEHRERVFGVFERVAGVPGEGGTGIGLAACRKIVEHMGGSIQLADVPKGTRVEIDVPSHIVRSPATAASVRAR